MSNILTVSKLNNIIRSVLETDSFFKSFSIIGEVSTLTKHYTGHYYFTLKDENSSIKCMMFASNAQKIKFDLKNGQLVLINGSLGVYDKTGVYQIYCREIFPYGEGQYLLELAKLKEKLKNEGLFDKEKKKLPTFPKKIGLITAKTGAAIHDFLTTLKRRFKVETYIFPCLVQGENAPDSIINAINLSENFDLDILVITRGGGSKEDLKCFNDESLIRRISELKIPLVSAVGHQVDTTLIDYVSDYSCITPTDAANKVVKSKEEVLLLINALSNRLNESINHIIEVEQQKILHLVRTLDAYSPSNKLTYASKSLISINNSLNNAIYRKIDKIKSELNIKVESLLSREKLMINEYQNKLKLYNEKLEYLNPLSLLDNGYSIVKNDNDEIITSINSININQEITIQLKDGVVKAKIIEIKEI